MGKANFWYNSRDRRWELRRRDGTCIAFWSDDGYSRDEQGRVVAGVATLQTGQVGTLRIAAGDNVSRLFSAIGTSPAVAAIGSASTVVATLTGMGSIGAAVGDKVFGNPKQALAGHIAFGGLHIPTTNVLNVYLANTKPDSAGSAPAIGWDVVIYRGS